MVWRLDSYNSGMYINAQAEAEAAAVHQFGACKNTRLIILTIRLNCHVQNNIPDSSYNL